jgi:UDP-N-acetylglucosamine pyrophosphorylase
MFCFSMRFIAHLFQELNVELPLHLARKKAPILLGTSKGFVQEEAQVWKCKRFIFDLLDYAKETAVLVCPREKIYAPPEKCLWRQKRRNREASATPPRPRNLPRSHRSIAAGISFRARSGVLLSTKGHERASAQRSLVRSGLHFFNLICFFSEALASAFQAAANASSI